MGLRQGRQGSADKAPPRPRLRAVHLLWAPAEQLEGAAQPPPATGRGNLSERGDSAAGDKEHSRRILEEQQLQHLLPQGSDERHLRLLEHAGPVPQSPPAPRAAGPAGPDAGVQTCPGSRWVWRVLLSQRRPKEACRSVQARRRGALRREQSPWVCSSQQRCQWRRRRKQRGVPAPGYPSRRAVPSGGGRLPPGSRRLQRRPHDDAGGGPPPRAAHGRGALDAERGWGWGGGALAAVSPGWWWQLPVDREWSAGGNQEGGILPGVRARGVHHG
mmetsp:Transcript_23351/g.49964  ORF Transcript_23351/g.49964 Transcript_23351/m.49964 type:complete len:273 (+) Transcript_23351:832-1650(+)